MQLWLRDEPERGAIGDLPAGVELNLIPRQGPLPAEIAKAEFLVPPYGSRRVMEALPQMPELRVIQAVSAGVEWLLPHVPAGVTVCNAKGARDTAVAEWVLATILASVKDLPRLQHQQESRNWEPMLLDELAGSRALIVGYGSIGRAVEALLVPFDVSVERLARRARPNVHGVEELHDCLPGADVVIALVPSTPATENLFDAAAFARMKPGALFVNAARGAVADTDALVEAVGAGKIRAAIDVTDPEPLPEDHPLWTLPGVLLTPHLAGDSHASERRVWQLIGEQVHRYVRGEPLLNVIER